RGWDAPGDAGAGSAGRQETTGIARGPDARGFASHGARKRAPPSSRVARGFAPEARVCPPAAGRTLALLESGLAPICSDDASSRATHSGILSCCFHGISTVLCLSILRARHRRRRVFLGRITSSM